MASASTSVSCTSSATAVASSDASAALQHHIEASIDFHLVVNSTIQQRELSLHTQARTSCDSTRTWQRLSTECTTVIDITTDPATPTDPGTPTASDPPGPSDNFDDEFETVMGNKVTKINGKLCSLLCRCRGLEAVRQQERAKAFQKIMAARSVSHKKIKEAKASWRQPLSQGLFTCKRCGEFGTPLRRCTVCGRHSFGSAMYTIARARSAPTEGELI